MHPPAKLGLPGRRAKVQIAVVDAQDGGCGRRINSRWFALRRCGRCHQGEVECNHSSGISAEEAEELTVPAFFERFRRTDLAHRPVGDNIPG